MNQEQIFSEKQVEDIQKEAFEGGILYQQSKQDEQMIAFAEWCGDNHISIIAKRTTSEQFYINGKEITGKDLLQKFKCRVI